MAKTGLPPTYIKKYGMTKRAWAEYRKAHPKRRTTRRRRNTRNPVYKVKKGKTSRVGKYVYSGGSYVGGRKSRAKRRCK